LFLQAKNVPEPFLTGALPRTSLGAYDAPPDPIIDSRGEPFPTFFPSTPLVPQQGAPLARGPRVPEGVTTG